MQGDRIIIRKADLNSLPVLLSLSIATFCDTFGPFNRKEDMDKYVAEEMNERKLANELNDRSNLFLLAWYNEEPAGYTKIRVAEKPIELKNNNPIEIERIYVLQQYHGKKVGASLLQYGIKYAIDHRHDVIWLGVWEHNTNAINFYKRFGFESFGAHPFILGDDVQTDMLMKKELLR